MAYPAAPAPAQRVRPSTVTISSWLLYLVAAVQVVSAIATFAGIGQIREIYTDAYAGTDMEGVGETTVTIGIIGGSVVALLLAVGLVVLAIFNNKGKNASRITTWVIAGIGVCCTGLGAAGSAFTGSMGSTGGANVPDPAEVQERVNEAVPWLEPSQMITNVIALLALLAVIILLALPPSNDFFRKPAQQWEPPTPGGGYQAYPAYPQAPGAPPAAAGPGTPPPAPGQTPPGDAPPPGNQQ